MSTSPELYGSRKLTQLSSVLFPEPLGPDDADHLPALDVQIDVFQDFMAAVALVQVSDLDRRHHAYLLASPNQRISSSRNLTVGFQLVECLVDCGDERSILLAHRNRDMAFAVLVSDFEILEIAVDEIAHRRQVADDGIETVILQILHRQHQRVVGLHVRTGNAARFAVAGRAHFDADALAGEPLLRGDGGRALADDHGHRGWVIWLRERHLLGALGRVCESGNEHIDLPALQRRKETLEIDDLDIGPNAQLLGNEVRKIDIEADQLAPSIDSNGG